MGEAQMFNKRKITKELFFIRQKLMIKTLEENLEVFEVLIDKEETVGTPAFNKTRRKLANNMNKSFKAVNEQTDRSFSLMLKLEKVHKLQDNRRRRLFAWLKDRLDTLEASEEEQFKEKYFTSLDDETLGYILKHKYSLERDFFMEDELKDNQEQSENEMKEKKEAVSSAQAEDTTLLATGDGVDETPETKEGLSKTNERERQKGVLEALFGNEDCGENDVKEEETED